MIQTSGATETGYRMQELERERQDWNSRIHQREAVIAGLSALPRIEQESRKLGLEPAQAPVYLDVPVPAPDRLRLPARYAPAQSAEESRAETLWQRLRQRLSLP